MFSLLAGDPSQSETTAFCKFKRQLYHASIAGVLRLLLPGMSAPVVRRCPDGHFRRVIYDFVAFIADYPCYNPPSNVFLFALLWTTQYTARSTAPSAYKYSTCTCTSCPAHIILTACPTCLQPIPYQLPSPVRCHRLLQTPPRLCQCYQKCTDWYGLPLSD